MYRCLHRQIRYYRLSVRKLECFSALSERLNPHVSGYSSGIFICSYLSCVNTIFHKCGIRIFSGNMTVKRYINAYNLLHFLLDTVSIENFIKTQQLAVIIIITRRLSCNKQLIKQCFSYIKRCLLIRRFRLCCRYCCWSYRISRRYDFMNFIIYLLFQVLKLFFKFIKFFLVTVYIICNFINKLS